MKKRGYYRLFIAVLLAEHITLSKRIISCKLSKSRVNYLRGFIDKYDLSELVDLVEKENYYIMSLDCLRYDSLYICSEAIFSEVDFEMIWLELSINLFAYEKRGSIYFPSSGVKASNLVHRVLAKNCVSSEVLPSKKIKIENLLFFYQLKGEDLTELDFQVISELLPNEINQIRKLSIS